MRGEQADVFHQPQVIEGSRECYRKRKRRPSIVTSPSASLLLAQEKAFFFKYSEKRRQKKRIACFATRTVRCRRL